MLISSASTRNRFPHFLRLSLSVLAIVIFFTACARTSHPDASAKLVDSPSPARIQLLDNTSWELVKWQAADQSFRPLPHGDNGEPITLTLSAESGQRRVSGYSGCNRYIGMYDLKKGTLHFSPLAGTKMACPPSAPGAALEGPYLNALAQLDDVVAMTTPNEGGMAKSETLVLTTKNKEVLTFMRRER